MTSAYILAYLMSVRRATISALFLYMSHESHDESDASFTMDTPNPRDQFIQFDVDGGSILKHLLLRISIEAFRNGSGAIATEFVRT